MSKVIYLAGPYSAESVVTRVVREKRLTRVAATLMQGGYSVFSPITQGVAIANILPDECLLSHDFWMNQDLPLLRKSDVMLIVPLPGWRVSRGVCAEIQAARQANIPIRLYQGPEDFIPHITPEEATELNFPLYFGLNDDSL